MANPANYPLTISIGDTKVVSVTMQDATGSPINIAGRTYVAQLRSTIQDSAPLATFTCSVVSGSAGTLSATLSSTTTNALTDGDGVWSLRETNGSTITTLLEGPVKISQSPTR